MLDFTYPSTHADNIKEETVGFLGEIPIKAWNGFSYDDLLLESTEERTQQIKRNIEIDRAYAGGPLALAQAIGYSNIDDKALETCRELIEMRGKEQ